MKELELKVDGYEASFTNTAQVKLINYILEQLKTWKDIAATYQMLIKIMAKE